MTRVYKSITFLAAAVLATATFTATAQRPPVVAARFVPDSIMIGDQPLLEVTIEKETSQELQLPQFEKEIIKGVEFIALEGIDTLEQHGSRLKLRLRYRVTAFDAGDYALTGFPVVYTDKNATDTVLSSEPSLLAVATFEIDTTQQKPQDIKRPLNTPFVFAEIKELFWWCVAGAFVLAGLIYLLVWWIRRRRGLAGPKVVIPPHITAIRALEKLHGRKLWQNGKHKDYYSGITDIVRTYIERRYGIGAMEMTTDQILEAMPSVNDVRLVGKLRDLFTLADLVKFAKVAPAPEENEQSYFDAYFYVEETKETMAEEEEKEVSDEQ